MVCGVEFQHPNATKLLSFFNARLYAVNLVTFNAIVVGVEQMVQIWLKFYTRIILVKTFRRGSFLSIYTEL